MAGANFYLKEPNSNSLTGIYLKAWLSGKPFKFYTGEKILPKEWSAIKQRPKPSYLHYTDVSGLLDSLEAAIQKLKLESINSGQGIDFEKIREQLARFINRTEVEERLSLFQSFDQFFEMKKVNLSFNYLRSAKTLRNHLHKYAKEKKLNLKFEDITLAFYESFVAYLYGKGLTANTVGTNINRLKYFLDWANLHGYNKTLDYKSKKFSAIEKPTDLIYLTEEELTSIYNLDLEGNRKLSNVRDTFCFGCFTGLRFSDISLLRKEDVKGDHLRITVQKTGESLTVPLNGYAMDILVRNNYRLPVISNQKTNDYLKEIAKLAEVSEPTKVTRFKGAEQIKTTSPKYELVSTHTARRTFITISLEKGMRPEVVMKITGHSSVKNFMKYVKISPGVQIAEMKRAWKKEPKPLTKAI